METLLTKVDSIFICKKKIYTGICKYTNKLKNPNTTQVNMKMFACISIVLWNFVSMNKWRNNVSIS